MAVMMQLPKGAVWMQRDNGTPQVITHPEHVKRLYSEGWHMVPGPDVQEPVTQPSPTEAELRAQLEALQAQLEQERAEKVAAAREAFKPSTKAGK